MNLTKNLMRILLLLLAISLFACSGIQPRYHRVGAGETVEAIAKRYEVPVKDLKDHNRSVVAAGVRPGSKLYIPFEANARWNEEFTTREPANQANDKAPVAYDLATAHFSWPTKGRMSSTFGKRHGSFHEGIDIAARTGTPVKAARSGHVIYAGAQISGYGKMVIVKHADNFSTVYAHLSRFNVKKGQFVARGSLVGKVGRTGRATGPHLHFEIRNNRLAVNPMFYLQPSYAANAAGK